MTQRIGTYHSLRLYALCALIAATCSLDSTSALHSWDTWDSSNGSTHAWRQAGLPGRKLTLPILSGLNGPCGANNSGAICGNGTCCSQLGVCGLDWDFCRQGCQKNFGTCFGDVIVGYQKLSGVDSTGTSLPPPPQPITTAAGCSKYCDQTPGCLLFTYSSLDDKCVLKTQFGTLAPLDRVVTTYLKQDPTSDAPAGYHRLAGFDSNGNDIIQNKNVTVQDCADTCRVTPGCKLFTYDPQVPGCFLKHKLGYFFERPPTAPDADTYFQTAAGGTVPGYVDIPGYNCSGLDVDNRKGGRITPLDCSKLCDASPTCSVFVHVAKQAGNECYLKSGFTGVVQVPAVDTYVKTQGSVSLQGGATWMRVERLTSGAVKDIVFASGAAATAATQLGIVLTAKSKVGLQAPSGQYLTRCRWCVPSPGGTYPDVVSASSTALDFANGRAEAQWTVVSLAKVLGKPNMYAFKADNGKYMARCTSCIVGLTTLRLQQGVFVYVSEMALPTNPAAHWLVPNMPAAVRVQELPAAPGRVPPVTLQPSINLDSLANLSMVLINQLSALPIATAYQQFLALYKQGNEDGGTLAEFMVNLGKLKAQNLQGKKPKVVKAPNPNTNKPKPVRKTMLGTPVKKASGRRRALLAELWEDAMKIDRGLAAEPDFDHNPSYDDIFHFSTGRTLSQAAATPASPDWSSVLSPVPNQGNCSCCWATVASALAEAQHFINTGQLAKLSYKQLLDCAPARSACDGGNLQDALNYIKATGLAAVNSFRAYAPVKQPCPAKLPAIASRLSSFPPLPPLNEAAMLAQLSQGPLAASVFVDDGWFDYSGGVYESATCGGTAAEQFNHAVLIVGAGVDPASNLPYWKVRNSWGPDWGEGGYMRLRRLVVGRKAGMCNIALNVYSAVSAAVAAPGKRPTPAPNCKPTTVVVPAGGSLASIAIQFKTTISQIMGDNDLDAQRTPILDGKTLTIQCPVGVWSPPFGYRFSERYNFSGQSTIPTVATCPPGSYVVAIYVNPSGWYSGEWTGSPWVGAINMTCSDGTMFAVNAQADSNPGWPDGTIINMDGFTSILFKSGDAIDGLLGVGATSGFTQNMTCPQGQVLIGFAAGAFPEVEKIGRSYLSNLQFQCGNPFVSTNVLLPAATRSKAVGGGTLCSTYTTRAGDTWLSVAAKLKPPVVPCTLIQSNPQLTGQLQPNTKLYIPPCVNGKLQLASPLKTGG